MKRIFILCFVFLGLLKGLAQTPGDLDASFNPGSGASYSVYSIALQPDGKVLIGGLFTSYNGTSRYRMARLNADGSLDASFNPGSGANNNVYSIALQPDGKILIGGEFISYNGTYRNYLTRLNADGSLDASFNPGTGASYTVYSIALQPDGKILIGGSFTSYNGTSRKYIARLNADGTLDASFNPGTGANGYVNSIALQPDGKVLIGGEFASYNRTTRRRIARLNADGSLDASFNPGSGANGSVYSIALQPDGKVLIGGYFTSYNGTSRNRIARLNADGSLDASFNPGTGASSTVYPIALQPDGKVLIGGYFTSYNGMGRNRIARIHGASTSLPLLSTDSIASVGQQVAWAYANVSSDGGAPVVSRGFCYNTTGNPTLADSTVLVGSGVGNFSAALSGLQSNTIYYVRAFATNSVGTALGNTLSFTTAAPTLPHLSTDSIASVGQQVAWAYANVSSDGGAPVVSRGFCYSTTGNPTLADSTVLVGSGVGNFSAALSGLQSNTIYYVRAFATNSVGTALGNTLSFTTAAPVCNPHNLSSVAGSSGHYNQRFNWTAITGASEHRLQYRIVGNSNWSGVNEVGTQRLIQNLAPGDYEARVYGVGLGDTSCLIVFTIGCATNISYATNVFQAGYLDALPASSARVTIFNVAGGKSLYNFELENLSDSSIQRVDNRRSQTYSQLTGGSYVLRVYDAYNCQAVSVFNFAIDALDTAYIPNLISAVNSSPNGFRPLWNRPRQNGQLSPGVLSYQLRVRNETDNQLVSQLNGITDTFVHVNNLTPGKLYRFNVRSRYNPGSGTRNSAYSIRRDRTLGAGGNKEEGGGVEEPDAVRIYPNPTADLAFVESPLGSHIKLLDLQGRIMQSLMAEGPISSLDLSPYAQGTYLLEINIQGQMHHQKVVKQ